MTLNPHHLRSLGLVALLPAFLLAACGGSDRNPNGDGPAPVSLGDDGDLASAAGYVLLAKTGITNVTGSKITGNVGMSPQSDAEAATGFALVLDSTGAFATSIAVEGNVYIASYGAPTPSNLTTAIGAMETAYTDAAGRVDPDFVELAAGDLSGLTLAPGLYKWSTSVSLPTDVTLSGSADDTWIFQIAGDLTMASAKRMALAGGAQAKNIVWQVAGQTTLDTTSHFEGTILSKTAVTMNNKASLNGRIYAQSLVALDDNAVTQK